MISALRPVCPSTESYAYLQRQLLDMFEQLDVFFRQVLMSRQLVFVLPPVAAVLIVCKWKRRASMNANPATFPQRRTNTHAFLMRKRLKWIRRRFIGKRVEFISKQRWGEKTDFVESKLRCNFHTEYLTLTAIISQDSSTSKLTDDGSFCCFVFKSMP